MRIKPDPHDRTCTGCGLLFSPYSMGPDAHVVTKIGVTDEGKDILRYEPEEIIVPPEAYECMHCRSLAGVR